MKKNLPWNKEGVTDARVFKDLKELSNGKIDIDENSMQLTIHKDLNKNRNSNNTKKK